MSLPQFTRKDAPDTMFTRTELVLMGRGLLSDAEAHGMMYIEQEERYHFLYRYEDTIEDEPLKIPGINYPKFSMSIDDIMKRRLKEPGKYGKKYR